MLFLLTTDHRPLTTALYSKTAAQAQFERVHLAAIGLVVVAAQVQEAVQDKLRDLFVECYPMRAGLSRRLLDRDDHVAQRRARRPFKLVLPRRERQHIRRP